MNFTGDYSRVSAFGWGDDEDDGSSRDPELEEEFLSRDWPEASKPLQGGRLKWVAPTLTMGKPSWSRAGGGRDAGPTWNAKASDLAVYQVWAMRKLNYGDDYRDRIVDDFYSYEFNPVCIWGTQPKKGKRQEKRREILGSGYDTLAEAQKVCEDHFRDHFG